MIVVDASLAAKWVLPESDSLTALRFLRRYGAELCGPDLLLLEVASTIVRHVNTRSGSREAGARMLHKWTTAWNDDAIAYHRLTPVRILSAGRLAIELGHPLKDCIYLALAIELDCDLATSDARFAAKAGDRYPRIRMLADYDLTAG